MTLGKSSKGDFCHLLVSFSMGFETPEKTYHAKVKEKIIGGTTIEGWPFCVGIGKWLEGTYGDLPIFELDVGRKVGNYRVLTQQGSPGTRMSTQRP